MPSIVITEFMDEAAVSRLKEKYDTRYDPGLVDRPDELAEAIKDVDVLIVRNRTQVRGVVLAGATKLKCVGRLGVGLDNIDVEACKARNVAVYPATGANDLSVAEYVMTAALMLHRRAWLSTASVIAGEWPRQKMVGNEIAGVTGGGSFEWLTIVCVIGLLLAAALGAYFVQTAYSVGSPDLVIAGLTVVDPLVAVVIGIAVLGEAALVPLWALLIWVVAAAVAIYGVFQLAKHHPQTHHEGNVVEEAVAEVVGEAIQRAEHVRARADRTKDHTE